MSNPWTMPNVETIVLDRVRIAVSRRFDRRLFLQSCDARSIESESLVGDLVLQLEATLLGKREMESVPIASEMVPADWVSHLRLEWGERLRDRWPWMARKLVRGAQRRTIVTCRSVTRVCPHIDRKFADHGPVHLEWLDGKESGIPDGEER